MPIADSPGWFTWALLSACFAALTAIFAKIGLEGIAKVAPIDKLSVVLVALFAVAFLGERPGAREWLGIFLVGGGVVVLALKR